jgi:hypothetical protein
MKCEKCEKDLNFYDDNRRTVEHKTIKRRVLNKVIEERVVERFITCPHCFYDRNIFEGVPAFLI